MEISKAVGVTLHTVTRERSLSDVSPVGLLHRLLDGPETDVVPLGDFHKVLKIKGVIRVELQNGLENFLSSFIFHYLFYYLCES